jgi:hypothetical protein
MGLSALQRAPWKLPGTELDERQVLFINAFILLINNNS